MAAQWRPTHSPEKHQKHVVFAAITKEGPVSIRAISSETGKVESELAPKETFDTVVRAAGWMPDNRYVAFGDIHTGTSNLWAHPAIGSGAEKQITHFISGVVWNFQYSPDGKLVAFSRGTNQSDAVLFTNTK
jgi:hypothetical protein